MGTSDGWNEGSEVGSSEGTFVGRGLGFCVGNGEGVVVGSGIGICVGEGTGMFVGSMVGIPHLSQPEHITQPHFVVHDAGSSSHHVKHERGVG